MLKNLLLYFDSLAIAFITSVADAAEVISFKSLPSLQAYTIIGEITRLSDNAYHLEAACADASTDYCWSKVLTLIID